jgi:hypothetical protein
MPNYLCFFLFSGGLSLWFAVFIILLAVAAYFLKVEGIEKLRLQYW